MGLGKLRRDQHAATLSTDHTVITSKDRGKILVEKTIMLEDRDHQHDYGCGSCSDVYRISSYVREYSDFHRIKGI